jgi:putative tryptophan/tyrosine transport system substrate-binding protein
MRFDHLKRRDFITLAGGAVVAWPIATRAQQPAMPVVGFLHSATPVGYEPMVAAFLRGLKETSYVEGQNVAIEHHWAAGHYDQLSALAADLVKRHVAVIAAGGPPAAHAAKAATATIPVVFVSGDDPVKAGLVVSFNRPGGNVTGVSVFTGLLGGKQLGLLRELVPTAEAIGMLVNPNNPLTEGETKDVQVAARTSGHQIHIVNAGSEDDFDKAFASLFELRVGALIVGADPLMYARRDRVVALAARYAIPAIYELREFAADGGLISYGASLSEGYRQVGIYTGRILKGETPAELPVQQPTKFELVINLKTAKTLGLTISNQMQLLADEVIE